MVYDWITSCHDPLLCCIGHTTRNWIQKCWSIPAAIMKKFSTFP